MAERTPFRRLARGFAVASALGSGFAGAVALGVLAGYAIDRSLGWRPIAATLALGLAGGIGGIVFVVRTIAALERLEKGAGRRTGPVDKAAAESRADPQGDRERQR